MTSKTRERRARAVRLPTTIWRGDAVARPPVQHGVRDRMRVSWRMVSGGIVLACLLALGVFFASDSFYVNSVAIGGLRYLTSDEIVGLTNIYQMHIFWVDAAEVREAVLDSPTVADAQVYVSLTDPLVQIIVQEREPAIIWEQNGTANWIDLQGRAMRLREDRPDLLRVVMDTEIEGDLSASIDPAVVAGALQLQTLLPDAASLRYHPDKGLGYNDPRGWVGWFGTGANMPEKLLIYNAIVSDTQQRGVSLVEVNVNNPDSPKYVKFER